MEGLERICFQIISNVGTARSSYIEAIHRARKGDYEGAAECMREGRKQYLAGHEAHFELIQKEAGGESVAGSLILVHAEDQLMSAEGFQIIAEELIDTYRKMDQLEARITAR